MVRERDWVRFRYSGAESETQFPISWTWDEDGDEIEMEPVKRGWWLMSLFIDTAAAAGDEE